MGRLKRFGVAAVCVLCAVPVGGGSVVSAVAWRTMAGTPITEGAVLVSGVSPLESVPVVSALAVDSSGTVYVLDRVAEKLMSFTPGQPLSVVIGARGAGDAADQLRDPRGIAVDAMDRVYVADTGNSRVLRFTPGDVVPEVMAGGAGVFFAPRAVVFDELDRMYVLDTGGVVRRFSSFGAGVVGEMVGDGNVAGIQASDSEGLVVGPGEDPEVFVADTGNDRVLTWNAGVGAVLVTIDEPAQLARHADAVLVAARGEHRVVSVREGSVQVVAGDGGATRSASSTPQVGAVAVGADGRVLVGEDGRVSRWENGVMDVLIGEEGAASPGSVAAIDVTASGTTYVLDAHQLTRRARGAVIAEVLAGAGTPGFPMQPAGLSVAENGDVFVSDGASHQVLQLSGAAFQPVAGTGVAGGSLAELRYPRGVAVDARGVLYIADTGNHRVLRWVVGAGSGVPIGTGEGAGLSEFSSPADVDVTLDGDVVVADTGNDRIVRWGEGGGEGEVLAGAGIPSSAMLSAPVSVAVAADGSLRVVSATPGEVLSWVPRMSSGVSVFSKEVLSAPVSVATDGDSRTYVADAHHGSVLAERLDPMLELSVIPDRVESGGAFSPSVTASPGAVMTWAAAPNEVCVNDGATVFVVGPGTCSVSVAVSGAWWRDAYAVQSFAVLPALDPVQPPSVEAPNSEPVPETVTVPLEEQAPPAAMEPHAVVRPRALAARCQARGRSVACSAKRPAAFKNAAKVSVSVVCKSAGSSRTKKVSSRLSTVRVSVGLKRGSWTCAVVMRQAGAAAERAPWRVKIR
jgi:sugar lactone lactonase YvrE